MLALEYDAKVKILHVILYILQRMADSSSGSNLFVKCIYVGHPINGGNLFIIHVCIKFANRKYDVSMA